MKKLIYIISVLVLCNFAKAQTFTVGNTCCNYNLVNYTFTNTCTPSSASISNVDSLSIDIDGDLLYDLAIKSFCYFQTSASAPYIKSIYLTSSYGTEAVFTASNTCASTSYTLANLPFTNPINSSLLWDSLMNFSIQVNATPATTYSQTVWYDYWRNWWGTTQCGMQVNPFYVGFRKVLPSNDTIYGWIRMDSNFPGKIIDYAYQHTNLTTNLLNSTYQILNQTNIYPNPATNKVTISVGEYLKDRKVNCEIISVEGKLLKSILITQPEMEVEISTISAGIYFVELNFNNNKVRKKLIITR